MPHYSTHHYSKILKNLIPTPNPKTLNTNTPSPGTTNTNHLVLGHLILGYLISETRYPREYQLKSHVSNTRNDFPGPI